MTINLGDPVIEGRNLANAIKSATLAVKAGETVDLEPLGKRVQALTQALEQTPPNDPEAAEEARSGLAGVAKALDSLEAALAARAPHPTNEGS